MSGVHHSAGRTRPNRIARSTPPNAGWPRTRRVYATGNDTLLGDDLYAQQPFCRQVLLHGFHFLFTCKPASHAHLTQWVEALAPGRDLHTLKQRVKSNRWEHHQYRWANAVPLTDQADALRVNWCELTITEACGAVRCRHSFITDWRITAENVAGLVAAALHDVASPRR